MSDFMFLLNIFDYYFQGFCPQWIIFRVENNLVENDRNGYTYSAHLILSAFSAFFSGRKCKIIGGFWELWELAFRMYLIRIEF